MIIKIIEETIRTNTIAYLKITYIRISEIVVQLMLSHLLFAIFKYLKINETVALKMAL